jgi:GT2 family glycosyltransferase
MKRPAALTRLTRRRTIGAPSPAWNPADGAERGRFVNAAEHAEVGVVVVTHNSARDIPLLIDGLRIAAHDRPIRLIVVDNQSTDDTVSLVRAQGDIILVEPGENRGYSGGINAGMPSVGSCENVLILNPDLELAPDAVPRLIAATDEAAVGAVVPLILDGDGAIHPSLGREPSLIRGLGDAVFGGNICALLGLPSEFDYRKGSYLHAHDVDWATGAALLVRSAVAKQVGDWSEAFFLYSEEVDYSRRIRMSGWRIRFEPSAVVKHRAGGSGRSHDLAALQAINRIRYIETYHGSAYSALFRAVVLLRHALRSYDPVHRHAFAFVLRRKRWQELPH